MASFAVNDYSQTAAVFHHSEHEGRGDGNYTYFQSHDQKNPAPGPVAAQLQDQAPCEVPFPVPIHRYITVHLRLLYEHAQDCELPETNWNLGHELENVTLKFKENKNGGLFLKMYRPGTSWWSKQFHYGDVDIKVADDGLFVQSFIYTDDCVFSLKLFHPIDEFTVMAGTMRRVDNRTGSVVVWRAEISRSLQ